MRSKRALLAASRAAICFRKFQTTKTIIPAATSRNTYHAKDYPSTARAVSSSFNPGRAESKAAG